MKRSKLSGLIILGISLVVIAFSSMYLYKYLRRWALSRIEREQLHKIERDLVSYRSLGFEPSSRLICTLEGFCTQLKTAIDNRDKNWLQDEHVIDDTNIDLLVAVNKKMLKSYLRDLQEYRRKGLGTESNLVTFSYDKVVRLTLALAELEKIRKDGLADGEYIQKIVRMKEITMQSIAYNKKALRKQLAMGKDDAQQREHLADKVEDLVELNKVLYL